MLNVVCKCKNGPSNAEAAMVVRRVSRNDNEHELMQFIAMRQLLWLNVLLICARFLFTFIVPGYFGLQLIVFSSLIEIHSNNFIIEI